MAIYGQYLVLISFYLQQIEFRNYIVRALFLRFIVTKTIRLGECNQPQQFKYEIENEIELIKKLSGRNGILNYNQYFLHN